MADRPGSQAVAFFDVDETLVSVRTLESFLLYYLERNRSMLSPERLRGLRSQVLQVDRAEFNRLYFGLWAGQPADAVAAAGRDWYRSVSGDAGFFRPNVLERLRQHRRAGARIVLVSGSFGAPLHPLAADVGADAVYCTELETDAAGRFTGRISAPMLGDDKGEAVDRYLARLPGAPSTTWGYGDHPSDLPLLQRVSDPVVVGTDPALAAIAAERAWPVLPIDEPLAPRAPQVQFAPEGSD